MAQGPSRRQALGALGGFLSAVIGGLTGGTKAATGAAAAPARPSGPLPAVSSSADRLGLRSTSSYDLDRLTPCPGEISISTYDASGRCIGTRVIRADSSEANEWWRGGPHSRAEAETPGKAAPEAKAVPPQAASGPDAGTVGGFRVAPGA